MIEKMPIFESEVSNFQNWVFFGQFQGHFLNITPSSLQARKPKFNFKNANLNNCIENRLKVGKVLKNMF